MRVIKVKEKNVTVHVEQRQCYWMGDAEIRFQNVHFEVNILRC